MTIKNLKAEEIRKSILQLAIQGKLVKQDPNDEPASELVKRIYAEKQKLIKEGKIKKDKNESYIFKGDDNCYYEKIGNNEPVKLEDLPFDIPDNWAWVRLNDIIHIQTGASFKKEQSTQEAKDGLIRVLRGGNILPFQYSLKSDDLYIPQELVSDDIILRRNDLITPAVTSLENIGKIAVINTELSNTTAGGFVYIFRPYFNNVIMSDLIADFVSSSAYLSMMKDITKKSGQAFYNMNKEKLLQLYFPIAPFAEMKRIVDKLNKCVPLVTEYSLFEEKLSKLESEFPEKLKKSILQYAIEGKLVKQDPNDEPASVLLERIKKEKERLIKEGKIKRDKSESYIYQGDDKNYYEKIQNKDTIIDSVFDIPSTWNYIRLSNVLSVARGGSPRPIQDYITNDPDGLNWIKIGDTNINSKYINSCKEKIKPSGLSKTRFVSKGDFLLTNSMSFGHPYILAIEGCIHDGWLVLSDFCNAYNKDYLYYLLSSPYVYKSFCSSVGGSVVKNLNSDKVSNTIIPLPPLSEQNRIVVKLDYIFNNLLVY